jgi:hypothetical protein
MTMRRLTLEKVKKAALAAYEHNLLLAQHSNKAGYWSDNEYKCAIATALSFQVLKKLVNNPSLRLRDVMTIDPEELGAISAIGLAHDTWALGKTDEKPLLALLNEHMSERRS